MSNYKRRVWPGALVILCLLAGFWAPAMISVDNNKAFAQSIESPDLIVESISWSPEVPVMGDRVTFTVTIRNRGDSQAGPSCVAYYIDDTLLNSADVNQISAGATVEKTFTWQTKAGEHTVRAIIDCNDSIAEANEANNEITYAFSVLAADLIIESITWSPGNPSIGDAITFTVTIKNQGNKRSGFSFVEFWIDGASRGQAEAGRLDAGASVARGYTWIAKSGQHTLKATADVLQQAIEGDEANNDLVVTYVTAPPDLVIEAINWSPVNRSDSDNVTMSVTVKNQGSGLAKGSWLAYYIDETFQASVFINPLGASATSTKTFIWAAGAEEHTFTAIIDIDNGVTESDETNNTGNVTLPALGPPDILIQDITWSPVIPIIDNWLTFTVTVKNAGTRTVSGCNLDFYISYGYEFHSWLAPIPAGGTVTASFPWIATSTSMKVRAVADVKNLIEESDESNNVKTASVTPANRTPETDLVIESVTFTPENPSMGDPVTITASVKNNGPKEAGESHVAYYVDGKPLETAYLNGLAPGAAESNSITWTATIGRHVIKAAADYNDYVFEIDESNNTAEAILTTASPDLVIQSVTWSPLVPTTGDDITLTLTIKNQGTLRAGSSYLSYYVDSAYQGNHYIEDIDPGAAVTRAFAWTFLAESHTFKVIIDKANSIIEGDESNNEKTAVIPAPDLAIEAITWSPAEPSENVSVTFVIMARNLGSSTAYSPYLDCYIDDMPINRLPIDSIAAGASAAGIFTWTARSGEHIFKVIADRNDSITESDESNNEKVIDLSHPGEPEEAVPAPEPVAEAEPAAAAVPVAVTESNDPEENDSTNVETMEASPAQDETDELDIVPDVADDSSAGWQGLLTNRWIIIGVGVVGGAVIVVLLLLRRRPKNS